MTYIIQKEYQQFFVNRGVPAGALFAPAPADFADYINTIRYESNGRAKQVNREKQRAAVRAVSRLRKPYLYVITGAVNDTTAQQLALLLCAQLINQDARYTFYWHTLTGAFRDKIRDDDVTAETVRGTDLLVISNIAKNSTPTKLEKLRDIIELYSALPRIVVASGVDPMTFCQQYLYVKPNFVTYFGSREAVQDE